MKIEYKVVEEHYDDGSIDYQEWRKDGKRHREGGPAILSYYQGGSIYHQEWYKDGKRHREAGPAHISYNQDGSIFHQSWYKDGKQLTKEEFESGSCAGKIVEIDGKKYKLEEVT